LSERRTEILDAALRVLAAQGMRGLTHRAVDAEIGIAAGSTSYYFRSRSALVAGCVERLLEIDMRAEVPLVNAGERPPGDLAAVLTGMAVARVTTLRHLAMARHELSLAALRDPELAAALRSGGDALRRLLSGVLRDLRATDPDAAASEVAAALEGMMFTALLRGPQESGALTECLRPACERVLLAQPGVVVTPPSRAG
jgi:DNA-binding transcriptional regulator YbjK